MTSEQFSFCCCIFGREGNGEEQLLSLSVDDGGKTREEESNNLRFLSGKDPVCLELLFLRRFPSTSVETDESDVENPPSSFFTVAAAVIMTNGQIVKLKVDVGFEDIACTSRMVRLKT